MAYKYFIRNETRMNVMKAVLKADDMIVKTRERLINQKKLARQYAVYQSVHIYGEYMALQERYPIVIKSHPINFYINDTFRNIYDFLFTHRTIDKFLKDYQEYDKLINQI